MAAKRYNGNSTSTSTRVTTVDPWIVGGEGRIRDLFPFPPWLILFTRFIISCFKHPIRTLIATFTIYISASTSDPYYLLIIPSLIYFFIASLYVIKHWYYSPDVPLFRRKVR